MESESASKHPSAVTDRSTRTVSPRPLTMRALIWRRFRRHVPAQVGSVVLAVLAIAAVLAPQVTGGRDPYTPDLKHVKAAPSAAHPLGTDAVGRDVFTRLVYASRVSLSVGLVAVSISIVIGLGLGLFAGYAGGAVDMAVMRAADVVLSFPSLMLIIVIVSVVGPSIYNVMGVLGFLGWPQVCRVVRANVLSLREQDFVVAARCVGVRHRRIVLRHILPNTLAEVIVGGTFGVAGAILMEAGLSFLGLGVQPPTASWGNMLIDAQSLTILESKPWLWVPPGLMIVLSVLSINFVGDGLRDALDPRTVVR